MARNLVVCFDGTNNQFGSENTNVVRMVQVLDRNPDKQLIYYDPGVGTMPEPGYVTPIGKWISKVFGLAFGAGLTMKIGEAYRFLIDHYEVGDRIFLFGFSRGAYTARALAGVLNQFGLLPAGGYNLIPYVLKYSKAISGLNDAPTTERQEYWKISSAFRGTFARIIEQAGKGTRIAKVHFLGLWDTVSSVGWIWEPVHFPYTASNPSVEIVRHAISVDEHRAFFRQNRWKEVTGNGQDVQELWFPGVHCDVGGGYPVDEGALWQRSFLWIAAEAKKAGLMIRSLKVLEIVRKTHGRRPSWADRQHESLTCDWAPMEFFPKLRRNPITGCTWPHINLFRPRTINEGEKLHWSVLRRIRLERPKYEPRNLSPAFREYVKRLEKVPPWLAYRESP